MATISSSADVEKVFSSADEALEKGDMPGLDRIASTMYSIQTLTAEQRAKMSRYFRTLSEYHEKKNTQSEPPARAASTPEATPRRTDHRIVALPQTDLAKRMERERAASRTAVENRMKNAESLHADGTDEQPEEDDDAKVSIPNDVTPEDLFTCARIALVPATQPLMDACVDISKIDRIDSNPELEPSVAQKRYQEAIIRTFVPLAKMVMQMKLETQVISMIFTIFCIRKGIPSPIRNAAWTEIEKTIDTFVKGTAEESEDALDLLDAPSAELEKIEEKGNKRRRRLMRD